MRPFEKGKLLHRELVTKKHFQSCVRVWVWKWVGYLCGIEDCNLGCPGGRRVNSREGIGFGFRKKRTLLEVGMVGN